MKAVTDVDVHEHLKLANEERKPVLSKTILHLQAMWKREKSTGNVGDTNFLENPLAPRQD
jgi:hypothetical protein